MTERPALPVETPLAVAAAALPLPTMVADVVHAARRVGQIVGADCLLLQHFGVENATVSDIMLPAQAATVSARTTDFGRQPVDQLSWSTIAASLGDARTALLQQLTALAADHGVQVYLVGGVVRAVVSPDEPLKDLDIAVAGSFDTYLAAVVTHLDATIVQQSPFRTATVALPAAAAAQCDLAVFDIVGLRTEHYDHIGALPRVEPTADLIADLHRRDLTINAMAVALTATGPHALYDPYDGRRDLAARVATFLHPVSLFQDPTRLVRLVRLMVRLGLTPSREATRQITYAVRSGVLQTVSHHRWLAEWQRCVDEPRFSEMLVLLQAWGIRLLLPGMLRMRRDWCAVAPQIAPQHRLIVLYWHIPATFLARLLPEWPELPAYMESIVTLRAARFSYVRWGRAPAAVLVARLARLHAEALPLVAALEPAFAPVYARYVRLTTAGVMHVGGGDLIAAGYAPGPEFGRFLAALQRRVYADVEQEPRRLETKAAQLALILAALRGPRDAFLDDAG